MTGDTSLTSPPSLSRSPDTGKVPIPSTTMLLRQASLSHMKVVIFSCYGTRKRHFCALPAPSFQAGLPVVMSSSISNSMSWVSSMSLVLCSTSFRKHRYPFSTVPTKRLLKCLLMDSTSTKEERRPAGTGKAAVRSAEHRRPVRSKETRKSKSKMRSEHGWQGGALKCRAV